MADWLVDPIIEKLNKICSDYLKDQVRWQTGMKEELQRLRENRPKIQAVILFASGQAEIRDQNRALNEWLWQLRNAVDEVDDVIDEFEYTKLKEQAAKKNNKRKVRLIMKSINKKLVRFCKRALEIDPSLKRLEEVVQKLDKISVGVDTFFLLVKEEEQEQKEQKLQLYKERETGSFPKDDQIGRWKEMNFVIEWLRNPSSEYETQTAKKRYGKISVLSIVGHGGMGKTTLLQHVYKEIMAEEFDLKMWVCVSIDFDAKKIITNMLESLKKERPRLETLDALQESLEHEVNSKKFLLVLDDIWEEDSERSKSKLGDVLSPLASAKLGSKILVTTRMDSVAMMISNLVHKKNEKLILEGLKEDELLQLLNKYAFANVEDSHTYQNLIPIAAKIVKKLLGSPLAAKVIGGVLNDRLDEMYWISVLESNNIGNHNDILSILKLSYLFLPNALQNCYKFCGVFPQDHEFDAVDLIKMWISLDFIQPSSTGGETAMDIGRRYFDILIKKSLFEKFKRGKRYLYKLHDILHELLRSVSVQECFTITNDEHMSFSMIPETIRYSFVKTRNPQVLRNITRFKYLHFLYLVYYDKDFLGALAMIFETCRRIRVLYIYGPVVVRLMPKEFGHLIHLRYLSVDDRYTLREDRSIFNLMINLYHLQFIKIDQFFSGNHDDLLRKNIDKLVLKSRDRRHVLCMRLLSAHWERCCNVCLQEMCASYVHALCGCRI